ncbi:hypothetical protein BY996DRAFT_6587583 [Phakopsora pachyrhizi]|nr:hypothetical protein BY996DRAFT_6587583 [Phakopsora pachyrhizi]
MKEGRNGQGELRWEYKGDEYNGGIGNMRVLELANDQTANRGEQLVECKVTDQELQGSQLCVLRYGKSSYNRGLVDGWEWRLKTIFEDPSNLDTPVERLKDTKSLDSELKNQDESKSHIRGLRIKKAELLSQVREMSWKRQSKPGLEEETTTQMQAKGKSDDGKVATSNKGEDDQSKIIREFVEVYLGVLVWCNPKDKILKVFEQSAVTTDNGKSQREIVDFDTVLLYPPTSLRFANEAFSKLRSSKEEPGGRTGQIEELANVLAELSKAIDGAGEDLGLPMRDMDVADGGSKWEQGLRFITGQSEDWNLTVNASGGHISFFEAHGE